MTYKIHVLILNNKIDTCTLLHLNLYCLILQENSPTIVLMTLEFLKVEGWISYWDLFKELRELNRKSISLEFCLSFFTNFKVVLTLSDIISSISAYFFVQMYVKIETDNEMQMVIAYKNKAEVHLRLKQLKWLEIYVSI